MHEHASMHHVSGGLCGFLREAQPSLDGFRVQTPLLFHWGHADVTALCCAPALCTKRFQKHAWCIALVCKADNSHQYYCIWERRATCHQSLQHTPVIWQLWFGRGERGVVLSCVSKHFTIRNSKFQFCFQCCWACFVMCRTTVLTQQGGEHCMVIDGDVHHGKHKQRWGTGLKANKPGGTHKVSNEKQT